MTCQVWQIYRRRVRNSNAKDTRRSYAKVLAMIRFASSFRQSNGFELYVAHMVR